MQTTMPLNTAPISGKLLHKIMDCSANVIAMLEKASAIHTSVNQFYDKDKPYSVHLEAVLYTAMKFGSQYPGDARNYLDVIAFGACFHDTIEDARLTYNDVRGIAKEFMSESKAYMAAEIVYALTNEKGRTRAERANDKYYQGIKSTPFATFVKLCDRYANMSYAIEHQSSMAKKYRQELPHFLASLVDINGDDYKYGVPVGLINALNAL